MCVKDQQPAAGLSCFKRPGDDNGLIAEGRSLSETTASRVACALLAATVLAFAGALALAISGVATDSPPGVVVSTGVFMLSSALVGAVVASKRPSNPIGWAMCVGGLDTLGYDPRGAVAENMQPAHVSLWLRGGPR
jgi:hypothetical protein